MILGFVEGDMDLEGEFSGYLTDTSWSWSEDAFSRELNCLSLHGRRWQYEAPHRRKAFGFIPVTECLTVPVVLSVQNVVAAVIRPMSVPPDKPLRFEFAEHAALEMTLHFDGGQVTATLSSWAPVILRDAGAPSRPVGLWRFGACPDWGTDVDAVVQARRIE